MRFKKKIIQIVREHEIVKLKKIIVFSLVTKNSLSLLRTKYSLQNRNKTEFFFYSISIHLRNNVLS